MYDLQSRWKLEGNKLHYYGLRNAPNTLKNELRITKRQARILASLPRELNDRELSILGKLVNAQVVEMSHIRPIPTALDQATFCTGCAANDFIIPGLEFDRNGLCPMCQTAHEVRNLKSLLPLVLDILHSSHRARRQILSFHNGSI